MGGNQSGGIKARDKILAKNPDHFRVIRKIGGSRKTPTGGFASMTPEEVREAGRKGGTISRRRKGHQGELTNK